MQTGDEDHFFNTLSRLEEEQQAALQTVLIQIQAILRGFLVRTHKNAKAPVATGELETKSVQSPPPGLYQCISGEGSYTTYTGKGQITGTLGVEEWKIELDKSKSPSTPSAQLSGLEAIYAQIFPPEDAPKKCDSVTVGSIIRVVGAHVHEGQWYLELADKRGFVPIGTQNISSANALLRGTYGNLRLIAAVGSQRWKRMVDRCHEQMQTIVPGKWRAIADDGDLHPIVVRTRPSLLYEDIISVGEALERAPRHDGSRQFSYDDLTISFHETVDVEGCAVGVYDDFSLWLRLRLPPSAKEDVGYVPLRQSGFISHDVIAVNEIQSKEVAFELVYSYDSEEGKRERRKQARQEEIEAEKELRERSTGYGAVSFKLRKQLDAIPCKQSQSTECSHTYLELWSVKHGTEWHCGGCKDLVLDPDRIAKENAMSIQAEKEDITAFGSKDDGQRDARAGVSSHHRGVLVKWLVRFAHDHDVWESKTWQVKQNVVQPMTEATRCRYVDLDAMRENDSIVGPADIFVSHCWGANFGDLVGAVSQIAEPDAYVWIDIFAVRQWPGNDADLNFRPVVKLCKAFLLCVPKIKLNKDDTKYDPTKHSSNPLWEWPDPYEYFYKYDRDHWDWPSRALELDDLPFRSRSMLPFTRIWCLVEIAAAHNFNVPIVVKAGRVVLRSSIDEKRLLTQTGEYREYGTLSETIQGTRGWVFEDADLMLDNIENLIEVERAEATVQSDKIRELAIIRKMNGGTAALQETVKLAVQSAKACIGLPWCQKAALGNVSALEQQLQAGKFNTDVEKAIALRSASISGYANVVAWLLENANVSDVIDGANVPFFKRKQEQKNAEEREQKEREKLLVKFQKETEEKLQGIGKTKDQIEEMMKEIMKNVIDTWAVGTSAGMQEMIRNKLGVETIVPLPPKRMGLLSRRQDDEEPLPEPGWLSSPLRMAVKNGHADVVTLLLEAGAKDMTRTEAWIELLCQGIDRGRLQRTRDMLDSLSLDHTLQVSLRIGDILRKKLCIPVDNIPIDMLHTLLNHSVHGLSFIHECFNVKGKTTTLIDDNLVGHDGHWNLSIVAIDDSDDEPPRRGMVVKAVRNDPVGFYLKNMTGTVKECLSKGGPGGYRVSVAWEWYPCSNWFHVLRKVGEDVAGKWKHVPAVGDDVVAIANSTVKFYKGRPIKVACDKGDVGKVMHVVSKEVATSFSDITVWIKWKNRNGVARPTGVPEKRVVSTKRAGVTLLMLASFFNHVYFINFLRSEEIAEKIDHHSSKLLSLLAAKDERGWTALTYAQRSHNKEAETALKRCCQEYYLDCGMTPLMVSSFFGDIKKVRHLVKADKGSLEEVSSDEGKTALHYAAEGCHPEVVRLLLEESQGPECLEHCDHFGNTPLMCCIKTCCHFQNIASRSEILNNRQIHSVTELLLGVKGKRSRRELALEYIKSFEETEDGTFRNYCLELLEGD
jgi:hypothetical protein